jgi:hypothetical protein
MTLKVQFFWAKKKQDTQATMSLLTTPFSTEDLNHNKGACPAITRLFDLDTRKAITSGQFFELQN